MRNLLLLTFLLCCVMIPASAGEYQGSISIQRPVGTPDLFLDDSPAVLCDLRLPNLLGPITVWGNVEHRLKDDCFQDFDNKFSVGGDLLLSPGFTVYSFFERRYSLNLNRIMIGARINFKGGY